MKIGILTFWWSNDNYGQLLQCYALQKYLRDMGHDAFLIKYNYNSDLVKNPLFFKLLKALNPIFLVRFFLNRKHIVDLNKEEKSHNREFETFRMKYIRSSEKIYNSYLELKDDSPEADIYIVGSDQVWNYKYLDTPRSASFRPMFLDFGNEQVKRIAYAASWGVKELPEEIRKIIKPFLSKFDYIGVREKSGLELCRECDRDDAEWVCDPTLLLSANTYRKIYLENDISKPKIKYILLYMLNNECDFDIQQVYDFAEKKELEVIYVTGNGIIDKRQKNYATIPEWLYLVDNAEYVITNSFHCGVFSTIFYKQFGIVPLTGKAEGMNVRFESLFELRGIGNRFILDNDFSILDKKYKLTDVKVSKKFISSISGISFSQDIDNAVKSVTQRIVTDNICEGIL